MKRIIWMLLGVVLLASCSKNKDEGIGYDPQTQGRVAFELVRNNVYLITALAEVQTIKVTVAMEDGDTIQLPSMPLAGSENMVSTPMYPLAVGIYRLLGYRCYDLQADLIPELDIQLTEDNVFEVVAGEDLALSLPTKVKQVLTTSNLYNSLRGICLEICGDDESTWPKSWDFTAEGVTPEWVGLEFDTDAMSNPTELIGIVIDGEEDYIINSDTWERQLASLPEFRHMTVLPSAVFNLTALQNIVVRNCDLEDVPAEIEQSLIQSFTVWNTNLASLPDEFGNLTRLTDLSLGRNKLAGMPECITRIKTLEHLTIDDERIASLPESLGELTELRALNVTNTDITDVPDVFDRLWRISTLDLHGNRLLSRLPRTVKTLRIPYDDKGHYTVSALNGILLAGCAFTQIPDEVQREGIRVLDMAGNRLTAVSREAIEAMTDLETLILDGNRLTSFPRLTNQKLTMLSLIGTGLTRSQVDLSGMPNLNPRYVFFTQEEYDAVFK